MSARKKKSLHSVFFARKIDQVELRRAIGFAATSGTDKACDNPYCVGEDFASRSRRAQMYLPCEGCLR